MPRGPFHWTARAGRAVPRARRIDAGVDFAVGDARRLRRRGATSGRSSRCTGSRLDRHRPCLWRPESGRLRATGTCTRRGAPTSAGSRSMLHDGTSAAAGNRVHVAGRRDLRSAARAFSPEYGRIDHRARCGRRSVNARRSSWARLFPRCLATVDIQIRRLAIEEPLPDPWLGAALSITSPHGDLLILSAAQAGCRAGGARLCVGTGGRADRCASCGAPSDECRLAARCHSLTGSSCASICRQARRVLSRAAAPAAFLRTFQMCGIAGFADAGWQGRANGQARRVWNQIRARPSDVRRDPASWAGRRRDSCRAWGRPRHAAPEHHRPGRRPSADSQRGRQRLDRVQRRDLQLPRAPRRARSSAAIVRHRQRHRNDRPCLRGVGRGGVRAAERHVRASRSGIARAAR